jgi:hypothetical protein|tara:strand:+ start:245 stop:670 length:426 start_codon:yes stop_codon:yes gene_type:complete
MPSRKSPVKKNADKERIAELENQLNAHQRKSKKLINQISDFQDEVGSAIVPFQKLSLYIFVFILFGVGLGLIIYAATHKDMDQIETTRSNMYIVGGILIAFAVVAFFMGRWWLNTVEKSPGLRKLNATMFEADMVKNFIKN